MKAVAKVVIRAPHFNKPQPPVPPSACGSVQRNPILRYNYVVNRLGSAWLPEDDACPTDH